MPDGGKSSWYPNQTTTPIGTVTNPAPVSSAATTGTELRAVQQAKLLFALSEGQVSGPIHAGYGLKDVCLNDVPIQNADGTFNFNGVSVAMVSGTATQGLLPGFPDVETLTTSGAQILVASPQSFTVSNPAADAVRVNISMPACRTINSDGSIDGSSVQMKFEVNTNGGGFVDVTNTLPSTYNGKDIAPGQIIGRSDGPFVMGYRISLPTGTSWVVRVSRSTLDTTSNPSNATYLQSYSVIVDEQLRYPATSILGVMYDASRFASMPKISVAMRGIQIQVPKNYTPATCGIGLGTTVTTTTSISVNGTTKTMTRSSGSFIADGFRLFQPVKATGFTNSGNNTGSATGNNQGLTITGISTDGLTLTFANSTTLVTESSASRTLSANCPNTITISASGKTFTRTVGSFVADGYLVGMRITTSGFVNAGNNGQFAISAISALTITCSTATGLADESTYATGNIAGTGWTAAVYATTGAGTSGGAWDGTFKTAWSSNPAWIFYDMATNKRYGAGRYLAAAGVDAAALYVIAQYCDGMVSDGMGGQEPRFVFNGYLTNADEAFKILAHIISCARAQLYFGGGKVRPVQDVDSTIAGVFTPSNVQDGKFSYTGTARKARHTQANIQWQDPTRLFATVSEPVMASDTAIARYGIQTTSPVAVGCTSLGQARRLGQYTILTEQNCVEAVSFVTGMQGISAKPGDLVLIQDPAKARKRLGGRIVSATTTSITLDAPTVLLAGQTYTLWAWLMDGTVASRTVTTTAGTVSTLALSSALPSAPQAQAQWLLSSSAEPASRWRIVSIKESQTTKEKSYAVTAVQQVPAIYASVDSTDTIVPNISTSGNFSPVTNLIIDGNTSWANGAINICISASWTAPTGATSYIAEIQRGSGNWGPMTVAGNGAIFETYVAGAYNVRVFAVYPQGISGAAVGSASTSSSLVPNWDSEIGPSTTAGGNCVFDTTKGGSLAASGYGSSRYVRALNVVSGDAAYWQVNPGAPVNGNTNLTTYPIRCSPGDKFQISSFIRRNSGSSSSSSTDWATISVAFYGAILAGYTVPLYMDGTDATGHTQDATTLLDINGSIPVFTAGNGPLSTGTWTPAPTITSAWLPVGNTNGYITAPPHAQYVYVTLQWNGFNGSPSTFWFDNIMIGQAAVGSPIQYQQLSVTGVQSGAALVADVAPFANAIATTQAQINSEKISVFRWFTAAQIADVVTRAGTVDVSTSIMTAHADIVATGRKLVFPAGVYLWATPQATSHAPCWEGESPEVNSTVHPSYGTQIKSTVAPFAITASTATSVLTVTVTAGVLAIGQTIVGTGIPDGTVISSLGTGTGGAGTYNLTTTPGTLSSRSMTAAPFTLTVNSPSFENGIHLRNLRFTGGGTASNGLYLTGQGNTGSIENLCIDRFVGWGLDGPYLQDLKFWNLYILFCGNTTNTYGLNIGSTSNLLHFYGGRIEGCPGMIRGDSLTGIFFDSMHFEEGTAIVYASAPIYVTSSTGVKFKGCFFGTSSIANLIGLYPSFTSATVPPVVSTVNCIDLLLEGCTFINNNGGGSKFLSIASADPAYHGNVSNCTFQNMDNQVYGVTTQYARFTNNTVFFYDTQVNTSGQSAAGFYGVSVSYGYCDGNSFICENTSSITAGGFKVGLKYIVTATGTTTTWSSCGTSWVGTVGAVGSTFTATAAGSGNGTAMTIKTAGYVVYAASLNALNVLGSNSYYISNPNRVAGLYKYANSNWYTNNAGPISLNGNAPNAFGEGAGTYDMEFYPENVTLSPGSNTVTAVTNCKMGQVVRFLGNGSTVINNTGTILLKGGVNATVGSNASFILQGLTSGYLFEISRAF